MGGLGAAAIAAAARRSRAAHEAETETAENAAKRFCIVMLGDDSAARDLCRINARQEEKLAVPQRDDQGVEPLGPLNIVRRVGDDRRRLDDELDVVGNNRSQENLQRAPQADSLPPDPRNFP